MTAVLKRIDASKAPVGCRLDIVDANTSMVQCRKVAANMWRVLYCHHDGQCVRRSSDDGKIQRFADASESIIHIAN